MVGVKVSEKEISDAPERDAQLPEPLRSAATAIEQQSLITGFDKSARAESVHDGVRPPSAQQGDAKAARLRIGSRRHGDAGGLRTQRSCRHQQQENEQHAQRR
jgi:hypothetical protein